MKYKTMLIATFVAVSTPTVAHAGEMVRFSYDKNELATPAKRELLLERIKKVSRQSCQSASLFASVKERELCAADLEEQFVSAIDDDELTLLAETIAKQPLRTASR